MRIASRLTKIERALRTTSESPPSGEEVRWAYKVGDRLVALLARQILTEDDARAALTDEQIAFMNSAEVARAKAICYRHHKARGIGPINLQAGRRLPKHDLAEIEAQQLVAKTAKASGKLPDV